MSILTRGQLEEVQAGTRPLGALKTVTLDGGIESGALAGKAAVTINPSGTNNSMVFTADDNGTAGNNISVEYRDPGVSVARNIDVRVDGATKKITVDLKTANLTKATGTLTSTGVFQNDDTVTIGETVYTFKTTLTAATTAFEVLIGANAAASLDNLKSAVNLTTGGGTTYGSLTTIHPTVTATTNTATTQVFEAKTAGTVGNLIATTETGANIAFGAVTLTGGLDAGQIISLASEVKTAVDAHTEAAALVDIADAADNDGTGVVTAMPQVSLTGGSDGKIPLFTVNGQCLVALRAYISVAGAGTGATLVHGKTGATNDLITVLTVTNFVKGGGIDSGGIIARGTALAKTPLKLYHDTETIFATTATAAATGGVIHYIADYTPLTEGAYVA